MEGGQKYHHNVHICLSKIFINNRPVKLFFKDTAKVAEHDCVQSHICPVKKYDKKEAKKKPNMYFETKWDNNA